jgi:hypothetical protein
MENKINFSNGAILGLCLVLGLGSCGYFISQTIYNSDVAVNVAEVKGLAERTVEADTTHWTIDFDVSEDISTPLPRLYEMAEERQQIIINFLVEHGFAQDEVEIGTIDYYEWEYRDDNQRIVEQAHRLSGSVTVNSHQVEHVSDVRTKINQLIAQGIAITNHQPRYLFTQLNSIKPAMLREATENARIAANEFAHVARVKVGSIRSARQGSFFIRDLGEDYTDDNKIIKNVRVVTTISFYLTD